MATDTKSAEKHMEELSKQIEALKADVSSITSLLGEIGKDGRDATAARLRETASDLRDQGERQLRHAQAQAEDFGHQTADAIRQQPATAVGLAVGVGFILGFLTSRR